MEEGEPSFEFEKNKEFPDLESVLLEFDKLVKKENKEVRNFIGVRKFVDGKGLYFYEAWLPEDAAGMETRYLFIREGKHEEKRTEDGKTIIHEECSKSVSGIDVTYFVGGEPIGGTSVAEYNNGEWIEL